MTFISVYLPIYLLIRMFLGEYQFYEYYFRKIYIWLRMLLMSTRRLILYNVKKYLLTDFSFGFLGYLEQGLFCFQPSTERYGADILGDIYPI